jgi:hypothetical protein
MLLSQGRLALPRHPRLLAQLSALEFEERDSGTVRIEVPERAGHDDLAMALCLAVAETDVGSHPAGGARIHIAEGEVPPIQLIPTRTLPEREPAPRVVQEGEERPVERLRHFHNARRDPHYRPPGTPWR